jgi:hypothetical protein
VDAHREITSHLIHSTLGNILIFYFELDPKISGIYKNFCVTPSITNQLHDSFFIHESGSETAKNELLTDDNTTITISRADSLQRLSHILDDFGAISWL